MSLILFFAAYLILGAFTGFFAGMLGIGGGLVMVPILTLVFSVHPAFPIAEVLHLALGTSMAAILFTAVASLRAHHQHGAVLWRVFLLLTPGILFGTVAGSSLAANVPAKALGFIFSAFVCLVALQMAFNLKPEPSRSLPGRAGMFFSGLVIGCLSALVAIGGGSMTVPFLTWCNVSMPKAIGTSAAVGLPIAIGGALSYCYHGWGNPSLPPGSLGYLYLPALAALVPAGMLTAPLGARVGHGLPILLLRRIFSAMLVLVAAKMLWGLLGQS